MSNHPQTKPQEKLAETEHVHGPHCNHGHDHSHDHHHHHAQPKIGRNDPCPCGSGKKFKKCCGNTV